MVIEARPVFADILRKLSRAGSDMVYLVYQLYCVLHRPGTGKWSEIFILILFIIRENRILGYSSDTVTLIYGYVLSSFSIVL